MKKSVIIKLIVFFILAINLPITTAARLPVIGGDTNSWGEILNTFLNISLDEGGWIRNNRIGTNQINESSITAEKINVSSINTAHIIDNTITINDLGASSVNSTNIVDFTILASDIANATITAVKLSLGIITAEYLASSSVNTTHIIDGTIQASDLAEGIIDGGQLNNTITMDANLNIKGKYNFSVNTTALFIDVQNGKVGINTTSPTTTFDVNGVVNATKFDLGIETITAQCSSDGCIANATCPSGKRVLYGNTADNSLLCDTVPLNCNSYCTIGNTSCSILENSILDSASVYVVCAKIAG